jgi:tRNA nucleotidyltransferase (CCA-adding enzyme)
MKIETNARNIISRLSGDVIRVVKTFWNAGYECFPVGGAVRDIILHMEREEPDYDLATDARPEEVRSLFQTVIPTGIKHGTVTVVFNDKHYEITTYRTDGKYSDNRHPDEVLFASTLEEDLARRDFTINALALDLRGHKLIDNYAGLHDLEHGIIRTIGDPLERFKEDGLRMMRACRFASVLGFHIENRTFEAIHGLAGLINRISFERIRDEFSRIILSRKPSVGLELLRAAGLMTLIVPELLTGYGIMQNQFHKWDIYKHNIETCDAAAGLTTDLAVRLSALFHDIGKPQSLRQDGDSGSNTFYNHEVISGAITRKVMRRLKYSNAVIDKVLALVRNHMFYYTEEWTDSAVRRFIVKTETVMDELFVLREADRIGSGKKTGNSRIIRQLKEKIERIRSEDSAFKLKDLAVSGHDVMKIRGITPSREVGLVLNALLQKVLEDPSLNTPEQLEAMVRDFRFEDHEEQETEEPKDGAVRKTRRKIS